MVTSTAEKHQIPGSVYRHDASQCRLCYDRAKKFADVDEPEVPRLDPAEDLAMYLRARRARKAKQARVEAARLAAQTRAYALHMAS